jgi:RNA polymerase sigma factor (sigma-70 family)
MDSSPDHARPPTTTPTSSPPAELDRLVRRAADGDAAAWNEITERFTRLVWAVARSYRLGEMDAADVVQNTWLRLLQNINRIEQPQALPKWLTTTARREALSIIRRRQRDVLVSMDADPWEIIDDGEPDLDAALLDDERDGELWACFGRLPERDQVLLRLLMASDSPSYTQIAAALEMPIGSIGPTRMRALAKLRQLVSASDYPFPSQNDHAGAGRALAVGVRRGAAATR